MLPKDNAGVWTNADLMPTNSSGKEVDTAKRMKPSTNSLIFKYDAILDNDLTSQYALKPSTISAIVKNTKLEKSIVTIQSNFSAIPLKISKHLAKTF
tara:strand:+ start:42808 stop:43098 length:291 start_codon:yes stop_codon:yes gene_type:complete